MATLRRSRWRSTTVSLLCLYCWTEPVAALTARPSLLSPSVAAARRPARDPCCCSVSVTEASEEACDGVETIAPSPDVEGVGLSETLQNVRRSSSAPHPLGVLWRFSRPHTMIGSALCIPALTLYAMPVGTLLTTSAVMGALYALPAALLMNLYITGLNQLLDIDIDKVNKPMLPLAAGELTPLAGSVIVGASLGGALALGWWHPVFSTPALRATLLGSALLGTLYSAPPVRLKRFPLLASVCIMAVRGALINWGFFTHAATIGAATSVTGATTVLANPLRCWAPVAFFTLFGM